MVDATTSSGREGIALKYFSDARKLATDSLEKLREYANNNLDVVLFSGEGDSLHQVFDCIVQVIIPESNCLFQFVVLVQVSGFHLHTTETSALLLFISLLVACHVEAPPTVVAHELAACSEFGT